MTRSAQHEGPLRVVGRWNPGAEVMLAVHALAGERVALTLVSASAELVLPALTVAEPFSLGHAHWYRLDDLLAGRGSARRGFAGRRRCSRGRDPPC